MKFPAIAIRQTFRQLGRDKRTTLASFLVLAIVLILVDLFWVASINIDNQYNRLLQTVRMELFINDSLPDDHIPTIRNALISLDGIDSVEYISKQQAAQLLEQDLGPGIIDPLEENPLPRSFIIHFNRIFSLDELDATKSRLMKLTGVEEVNFGRMWIKKVENIGRTLKTIGYITGGLILFVVLITMANTNRLTARSKAQDFFQLKLLGAGPAYLVIPYLAEGFLAGLIAALLGWTGILYGVEKISFTYFDLLIPPVREILIYSLLAGLTGMAGSYVGIRRYLIS